MARFVGNRVFDINLHLSPKVRRLVEKDVLDHYRDDPELQKKLVTRVYIKGNLDVMIVWEDPEEEG